MFLISKAQEGRIRRQERKRAKKILRDFALRVDEIQRKQDYRFRGVAIRAIQCGYYEGFDTGKIDPGLSRSGYCTKALAFAHKSVDFVLGFKK